MFLLARAPMVGVATAVAAALAACSGGEDVAKRPAAPVSTAPGVRPQPFPQAQSRTLTELRRELGPGPQMASAVSVLEPGRDRVAFALFDRTRRQIGETPAALYVAQADGTGVRGPFHARYRTLGVRRPFQSWTVTHDPDSPQSIYVARAAFPKPGRYRVLGVTKLDQRFVGGRPVMVTVHSRGRPPAVGQLAPRVHTPTRSSVRGRLREIDTRRPPGTMHDVDLASVLGRRPVMLLFASPGRCPSHACGPVADVMEQLKAENSDDAAFVQVEIFNHNDPRAGRRSQVRAYGLPSQPWLFAIDRHGRVAARIEGAFSLDEARAALRAVTRAPHARK